MGLPIAGDLETAVCAADKICCATMVTSPVIKGAWLQPSQHLDLIGGYTPAMRKLGELTKPLSLGDTVLIAHEGDDYVARSRLLVERLAPDGISFARLSMRRGGAGPRPDERSVDPNDYARGVLTLRRACRPNYSSCLLERVVAASLDIQTAGNGIVVLGEYLGPTPSKRSPARRSRNREPFFLVRQQLPRRRASERLFRRPAVAPDGQRSLSGCGRSAPNVYAGSCRSPP
jgi:hypothetical protein